MLYMIGRTSPTPLAEIVSSIGHTAMVLHPGGWQTPSCPHACDNGVYAAWTRGRLWDQGMHNDWLAMLKRIPAGNPPLWVLLPDAVGDWHRTMELCGLYLPLVRQKRYPVAVALQDGFSHRYVEEVHPEWVFVGGTTEWKEDNVHSICDWAHAEGMNVHVGRVNTRRRLMLCQSAGADSVDGTTLNKFTKATLPLISNTLAQGCLRI